MRGYQCSAQKQFEMDLAGEGMPIGIDQADRDRENLINVSVLIVFHAKARVATSRRHPNATASVIQQEKTWPYEWTGLRLKTFAKELPIAFPEG